MKRDRSYGQWMFNFWRRSAPFSFSPAMYEISGCSTSLQYLVWSVFLISAITKISLYSPVIYREAGNLFGKNLEPHLSFTFRHICRARQNAPLEKKCIIKEKGVCHRDPDSGMEPEETVGPGVCVVARAELIFRQFAVLPHMHRGENCSIPEACSTWSMRATLLKVSYPPKYHMEGVLSFSLYQGDSRDLCAHCSWSTNIGCSSFPAPLGLLWWQWCWWG